MPHITRSRSSAAQASKSDPLIREKRARPIIHVKPIKRQPVKRSRIANSGIMRNAHVMMPTLRRLHHAGMLTTISNNSMATIISIRPFVTCTYYSKIQFARRAPTIRSKPLEKSAFRGACPRRSHGTSILEKSHLPSVFSRCATNFSSFGLCLGHVASVPEQSIQPSTLASEPSTLISSSRHRPSRGAQS